MKEIALLRTPQGALVPADDDEATKVRSFPMGVVITGKFATTRNGKFHRKMMSLFRLCFDRFSQQLVPAQHKGQEVTPSFDRFRHDLTILAGHYKPTYKIDGSVILEATSLSYASLSQEEAEQLYSDVIDAAIRLVYRGEHDAQWLRDAVDQVLAYA